MRLPLRFSAIAVAFLLAFVSAVPPARADMGRPTWTVGDFWVYAVTGEFVGFPVSGTVRIDVVGVDTTNVAGFDYQTYRTRLTVNASGVVLHSGDVWYRISDLAVVKQFTNVTLFGFLNLVYTITFAPPLTLEWPFTSGKAWQALSTVTTVTDVPPFVPTDIDDLSFRYTVLAATTITVPAGTFETTPLEEEGGSGLSSQTVTRYYSPAAGNSARTRTFDSGNTQTGSADLVAYNYAAASYILGLPVWMWLLLLLVLFVAIIVLVTRRRRPKAYTPIEHMPQQMGGTAWRQEPPGQTPPQQGWNPPPQR